MSRVEQMLYTGHPERWWTIAPALGFAAPYPPTPEWGMFDGGGALALHHASADHPAGSVHLHVQVDDLDAAERALDGFAVTRGEMSGVGTLLTVTTREGVALTVAARPAHAMPDDPEVAVEPIWFANDLDEPRRILEALGFRAGIVGDAGGWVELTAPGGGMVALHALGSAETADEASIGLSFLARGDLDALAERIRAAGVDAAVIDEAFGRTIRFPHPDGGHEVWINGLQDDLHGYHREG
ncbi:hypothetical protein [Microbacterium rhizophilus]|uniref:hypothetical protein n=1 Tax=Microbacterium rhizophilus TaxID=3138934 RepID=UPI0031E5460D